MISTKRWPLILPALRSTLLLFVLFVASTQLYWGIHRPGYTEVAGVYVGRYSYGTHQLDLRPDRTYTETFRSRSGRVMANHGHWEVSAPPDYAVELENCLNRNDLMWGLRDIKIRKAPDTYPIGRRLFGRVYLQIPDDRPYEKVRKPVL